MHGHGIKRSYGEAAINKMRWNKMYQGSDSFMHGINFHCII